MEKQALCGDWRKVPKAELCEAQAGSAWQWAWGFLVGNGTARDSAFYTVPLAVAYCLRAEFSPWWTGSMVRGLHHQVFLMPLSGGTHQRLVLHPWPSALNLTSPFRKRHQPSSSLEFCELQLPLKTHHFRVAVKNTSIFCDCLSTEHLCQWTDTAASHSGRCWMAGRFWQT